MDEGMLSVDTTAHERDACRLRQEWLAIEEPLQISLEYYNEKKPVFARLAVTMRTPGDDFALALGYLRSEGIIQSADDVVEMQSYGPTAERQKNEVRIALNPSLQVDLDAWQRYTYVSASCGICGKTSIETLQNMGCRAVTGDSLRVSPEILRQAPHTLLQQQSLFGRTGGLHAAALFDEPGHCVQMREDVGRHNAVDKLIGAMLMSGGLPPQTWLLLSGRISFELVQKAAMVGIPLLAAVGAPSSLAVEAARHFNISLVGFLREQRFNVYGDAEQRIQEMPL